MYIHVPFCAHICPYCDFVKTSKFRKSDVDSYFKLLEKQLNLAFAEISVFSAGQNEKPWVTVYFGGGTPGLFNGQHYEPIIQAIQKRFQIEECSIETNPHLVTEKLASSWKAVGFDRVTLGAQSLDENVLQFLGRKHTKADVLNAHTHLKKAGFSNIQSDLIYGLPEKFGSFQNLHTRSVVSEIQALVEAGSTGISTYALGVEPGTVFGVQGVTANDEKAIEEYSEIRDACSKLGMPRRETSNFSKFECKHNNIYWYGHPYIGLGTGAHGLSVPAQDSPYGKRYSFGFSQDERAQHAPGDDILKFQESDELPSEKETRSHSDYLSESVFTFLRTPEGIPGNWLRTHGHVDWNELRKSSPLLQRAIQEGRILENEEGGFRLHENEFLLGDKWHADFSQLLQNVQSQKSEESARRNPFP